jgi:hypothetical protein
MRFLRNINLNPKAPRDQRLVITKADEVQFNSSRSIKLPSGTTAQRAASPTNGMMRLNTDTNQVEVYQSSSWRSLRYKESGAIAVQSLGTGDGISTLYGPLIGSATPPSVSQSGYTWTGANLMVYVENVFQIYNTNYLIAQNPTVSDTVSTLANIGSTNIILASVADIIVGSAVTTTAPTTTVTTTVNATNATATYVSGGVVSTTMVVSGKSGTFVDGQNLVNTTGFNTGQYIASGSATTSFVLNAVANSTPSGTLTFAAWGGSTNLIVASTTSIIAGMFVNGIGFNSGQTVISASGDVVVLSAPPDSTPSGTVVFTSSASGTVFAASTIVTAVNSFTNTITINNATTGAIAAGRGITMTLPVGYYVRFTGPAAATKPITVISGFDS